MGKLITVIGATGVGKTTLVRALCNAAGFTAGLEEHEGRPFQVRFKQDPGYAFRNQVDYLLLRARQEQSLRQSSLLGIMDGGLEMDFFAFTRLFHVRGWLSDSELTLCKELYDFIRSHLPLPEVIIYMRADQKIVTRRLEERGRINIASSRDITLLDSFLEDWLLGMNPQRVLLFDASRVDPEYKQGTPLVLRQIQDMISPA